MNMNRRAFASTAAVFAAASASFWAWDAFFREPSSDLAKAARRVLPYAQWTGEDFFKFLTVLPERAVVQLREKTGIDTTPLGHPQDALDIQAQTVRTATHLLMRPFTDYKKASYHEIAVYCAKKAGLSSKAIDGRSSLQVERLVMQSLFAEMWDRLPEVKRLELLKRMDPNGEIKDAAAVTSLGGAAAISALTSTVAFQGFGFYIGLSTGLHALATMVGVTLPFGTYTAASSAVAFLSGPVGWALASVAALGGLVWLGGADARRTADILFAMHNWKLDALRAVGTTDHDIATVFAATGRATS